MAPLPIPLPLVPPPFSPSVSTLQDVLVYATPRLLHPSTAISSSLVSFSSSAGGVIGLTINSTAQLAQVLLMPPATPEQLAHR